MKIRYILLALIATAATSAAGYYFSAPCITFLVRLGEEETKAGCFTFICLSLLWFFCMNEIIIANRQADSRREIDKICGHH